jgi:hypothetical protein
MLLEPQFAEPYKSWAQTANNLGSLAAILVAAIWFFMTRKFRRRIQLDLDCKIYDLASNPLKRVAEIQFCIENKGLVNHRMRELTVSIHSLQTDSQLEVKDKTGELVFPAVLLERTNIVPPDYRYYFVRPGIRQLITHIVPLDASISLIRVTAGFHYDRHANFPHTVRRVFQAYPAPVEVKPSTN